MPCKCGSYTHKRSTHKDCPLKKAAYSQNSDFIPSSPEAQSPEDDKAQSVKNADDAPSPKHQESAKPSKKRKSWVILTSFESKYPSLHTEVSKVSPKSSTLKKMLKKIISPLLGGGDVHKFASSLAESFACLIHEYRENNNLPEITVPTEDVANEITGAVLGGMHINLAKDIAAEMPLGDFDTTLSMQDSIQYCYDTTETEHFASAVDAVIMYPKALLYAVRMYKKTNTSDHVKKFLHDYSKCLYFRYIQIIEVKIMFKK